MTTSLFHRSAAALIGSGVLFAAAPARAQFVESVFPSSVPGFDRQAGVTVLSRLRPLYEQPGIRLGAFTMTGGLDERVGYDSNITGVSGGPQSGYIETAPQVSAISNWSRNRLGISAGMDNFSYFTEPRQNFTNYNVSIGGGLTIGRHDLNLGYSHLSLHQLGTDITTVRTTTPISYNIDAIRGDYTFDAGRFSFVPNIDVRLYQFGDASVGGAPSSQSFRDRTVATGGVTTKYELSDQRSLVMVVQGSSSHYIRPQQNTPSNNSKTVLVMAGIDYQATGPWRYRLLAGGQVRSYQAGVYGTHAAPVVVASVIWSPTGLTTLTGTVRREIEDAQSEGTSGFTYTTVQLVGDHELQRNVLLQGRATYSNAEYLQGGGSSNAFSLGGGVNWLVNRRLRLSADYDYTTQTGSGNGTVSTLAPSTLGPSTGLIVPGGAQLNTVTTGNYSRNVLILGVHIGL